MNLIEDRANHLGSRNTILAYFLLSQLANRIGILSLGNVIPDLEPFLLRKGMELLTEAYDYIDTKNIMDNLINSIFIYIRSPLFTLIKQELFLFYYPL